MQVNNNPTRPALRLHIEAILKAAARIVEQLQANAPELRSARDPAKPDPAMPQVSAAGDGGADPNMHTMKAGETMADVAAQHGMSLDALMKLNPQISNPASVCPGQKLVVADAASAAPTTAGAADTGNASGSGEVANVASPDATSTVTGDKKGPIDLNDVYNRYRGGSYVYGGGRDGNGFGVPGEKNSDCSAFVSAVWKEHGLDLPAHTDGAYNKLKSLGAQTTTKDPKPGDVVFWMGAGTGGGISHHVGIYMGDGKVLQQTGSNGGGVQIGPLPQSGIEILRDPRL